VSKRSKQTSFDGLVDTSAQRGLNAKVEAAKIEAASDAKIILLV